MRTYLSRFTSVVITFVVVKYRHSAEKQIFRTSENGSKHQISLVTKYLNEPLTGRLLHLHHQGLQGVESLQLLLLILQVFLQQFGPLLDLLTIHLVWVLTCTSTN